MSLSENGSWSPVIWSRWVHISRADRPPCLRRELRLAVANANVNRDMGPPSGWIFNISAPSSSTAFSATGSCWVFFHNLSRERCQTAPMYCGSRVRLALVQHIYVFYLCSLRVSVLCTECQWHRPSRVLFHCHTRRWECMRIQFLAGSPHIVSIVSWHIRRRIAPEFQVVLISIGEWESWGMIWGQDLLKILRESAYLAAVVSAGDGIAAGKVTG